MKVSLNEKVLRASNGDGLYWRTKSGRLVRQEGLTVLDCNTPKIRCFNTTTSGYHGLLRIESLEVP